MSSRVHVPPRTRPLAVLVVSVLMSGCAPEVGSTDWCEAMDEKEKGEWSGNEMRDYAKHCIFRKSKD